MRSRRLAERVGCRELYFKLEMCNPTGSFKDRGMVVAVAKALEDGAKAVLCASTGNTSASAAAYAAHCGLDAYVLVPHGNIAQGKLAQAVAHGARILAVRGNFDDALRLARVISEQHPVALVNSVNPHRIEGQKTAAFEIVDALGDAPDLLFIPVGNAGNITRLLARLRRGLPGRARLEKAAHDGLPGRRRCADRPRPARRGPADRRLRHPHRQPRQLAARRSRARRVRRRRSTPSPTTRSSRPTASSRRKRASSASPPPPPASLDCSSTLELSAREHSALSTQTVVCIITGHGLKDPDTALAIESEMREVEPRIEAIEEAMGL